MITIKTSTTYKMSPTNTNSVPLQKDVTMATSTPRKDQEERHETAGTSGTNQREETQGETASKKCQVLIQRQDYVATNADGTQENQSSPETPRASPNEEKSVDEEDSVHEDDVQVMEVNKGTKVDQDGIYAILHKVAPYVVIGTKLGQLLQSDLTKVRSPDDLMSAVLMLNALKHFAYVQKKFPEFEAMNLTQMTAVDAKELCKLLPIAPFAYKEREKQWMSHKAYNKVYSHAESYRELIERQPGLPFYIEAALDQVRVYVSCASIKLSERLVANAFQLRSGVVTNEFPHRHNPFTKPPGAIIETMDATIRRQLSEALKQVAILRPIAEKVGTLETTVDKRRADNELLEAKYISLSEEYDADHKKQAKVIRQLERELEKCKGDLRDCQRELTECQRARDQRPEEIVANLSADQMRMVILSGLRSNMDSSRDESRNSSQCNGHDTETEDERSQSRSSKHSSKKRDSSRRDRDRSGSRGSKKPRR